MYIHSFSYTIFPSCRYLFYRKDQLSGVLVKQVFFFFLSFIELHLIYNVVTISAVQQSDSAIHTHTHFFLRFFSHIGYYRMLGSVPCAIQQVPVDHSLHIQQHAFGIGICTLLCMEEGFLNIPVVVLSDKNLQTEDLKGMCR